MGWFDDQRILIRERGRGGVGGPGEPPGGPTGPRAGTTTPTTPTLPGVMPGWDPNKWVNAQHTTPKYVVGRILARYPSTPDGLRQALPEIQAAFPGASIEGGRGDRLRIPGAGEDGRPDLNIDVGRAFGAGGNQGWQWIDIDAEAANAGGGNQGIAPNLGIAPNPGIGGGGSGWDGGGGGGTGGDAGGGGWSMPRGSEYQFAGVPGYSGGYRSNAFAVPGQPNMGVAAGAAGIRWPGQPSSSPSGPQLFGGGASSSGAAGAPPWSSSSGVATGAAGGAGGASGAFGIGMLPPSSGPNGGRQLFGGGSSTGAGGGGYDRAPSYTPMDPFEGPDVPDAYPEWNGTAFDVGPGAEKFVLPTGQAALEQDPGYQFRLEQGLKALEGSAAARGLLRTGGTLKDIEAFGQRAGSQEYQNAVDRALAVAGFNETNRRGQLGLGLQANDQNNRYGLAGSQFNAGERDRNYQNRYTSANQRYAYANQQNAQGNAQALEGYKTDVGRDLGLRGLNLTAEQNAAVNRLNGQQQQWMQIYMQNGQSFDQAYRMMMARLQYPA